jgi:hypothetical protein
MFTFRVAFQKSFRLLPAAESFHRSGANDLLVALSFRLGNGADVDKLQGECRWAVFFDAIAVHDG